MKKRFSSGQRNICLLYTSAAAYSGIGINKLRSMTDSDECKFVLWNGTKRLIKRRKLDVYKRQLYDRSDGFYRRQLILTTKDKPLSRVDDPDTVSYTHLDVYKRQELAEEIKEARSHGDLSENSEYEIGRAHV